jgi:hypothetical protein
MRLRPVVAASYALCLLGCMSGLAQGKPDVAAIKARLDERARSYTPQDTCMPNGAFMGTAMLSNGNGAAADQVGKQLLQVALAKTGMQESEQKAVPIAKEELPKFVGEYVLSPTFSVTFAVDGDSLTAQATGEQPRRMIYLGAANGHPRFRVTEIEVEIEFVPDASGAYSSIITHVAGRDTEGKKKEG